MTTATQNRMDAQFGYAETGTKVHMGLVFDGSRCIQGPAIVNVIATVGEDAGRDGTFAALTAANVKPAKLCGHCFPIAIRRAYAQHIAAVKTPVEETKENTIVTDEDVIVVTSPDGTIGEVRPVGNGRWGHFTELSKITGRPGATSTDRDALVAFLTGGHVECYCDPPCTDLSR